MRPRVFTLRISLSLIICTSLLVVPGGLLRLSNAAQGHTEERKGRPKPGKPEGEWPNLEEVKHAGFEREAPPPIPSTIRSRRNGGRPWDGRRVGDPEAPGSTYLTEPSAVAPGQSPALTPQGSTLAAPTLGREWLRHRPCLTISL